LTTYPEHEKLRKLNGANQAIGDFLNWLHDNGFEIAKWRHDELVPSGKSRDDLIAEFCKIDRDKLDDEKRAMLVLETT
jgi:hypothetical protein